MPADFLTQEQKLSYGRYPKEISDDQLSKYFYLDDHDKEIIFTCRRSCNQLGYALQLTTVRFIGTFMANPIHVPTAVKQCIADQLGINDYSDLANYIKRKATSLDHIKEIKARYGYCTFDGFWRFRLSRWLYSQFWFGTERPSMLFERTVTWLIERKILLPGITVLTRLVSQTKDRAATRLWLKIVKIIPKQQKEQLENLLTVTKGDRYSVLDQLKDGPRRVSSIALIEAINRYNYIKTIGISNLAFSKIPKNKLMHLARYVTTSWAPAVARMPESRRIAVLAAFAYVYEIKALDDALDLLDMLITEISACANNSGEKERLRTLGDLDKAALELCEACEIIVGSQTSRNLLTMVYNLISKEKIIAAVNIVKTIARPKDDKYYKELVDQYKRVRRFLPNLLKSIHFSANKAGNDTKEAIDFLISLEGKHKPSMQKAPQNIITSGWRKLVFKGDSDTIDRQGYTLCALENLQINMRCRDVFVSDSDRWCDSRAKLLSGKEWQQKRGPVCRSLNLALNFDDTLKVLSKQLDFSYSQTAGRLKDNADVEIVTDKNDKKRIKLSRLDKLDEPNSLTQLKDKIEKLLPKIDLPELLLEVNRLTGFANSFTHISMNEARVADLDTSICAILMAEACNIGIEPIVNPNNPALTRNRLSWIQQNYINAEGLVAANATLVDYQTKLPLAKKIGSGDVASADGLRFTSAIKTVNSAANKKYFKGKRGITYYNYTSDQDMGFHGIVVTGTMRDSIFLLDGLQNQQTSLTPTEIMTDTAGVSEVVFALFWLLGYQFSPRLADIGSTRFWRIDTKADYGDLNDISKHRINTNIIKKHWDDILRVAVSLKLGYISGSELIRALFKNSKPSGLAIALMNLGRSPKTLYLLRYIDDKDYRRHILTQLNRGECRNGLARTVYHGHRGEIRKKYREGQEDQLGALGLVTNAIALWNTIYMQLAIETLKMRGEIIYDEDIKRLSLLMNGHVNVLGHYSFSLPKLVEEGYLRPLNETPNDEEKLP